MIFAVAGHHAHRPRRAREEVERAVAQRERQRRAVLRRDLARPSPASSWSITSLTVPTLPPQISERRKISGDIQRSRLANSSGVASS